MSKLRTLKMATFARTTLLDVMNAVNDFTAGKALTNVQSGTVAYAAGFVAEKTLIDQQYMIDGSNHVVALFYIE